MTDTDDPIAPLARALDQTGAVIARVRPDQAALPTPCRSWDVRALVGHVVDETRQFARVTAGGTRQPSAPYPLGDDWAGDYDAAAAELLAAWRQPGALDRKHALPFGEIPAEWALDQHLTELVIHAWDIAKATGQPTDLDPELGRRALAWGLDNLKPEYRGDEASGSHIGPERTLPEDAPLYDRLAAFGGRDPRGEES
jgi:uncharacterized protein (TIGR03086 family)